MTNAEILITECALHNVTEAVDTFAGWKRKGYSVKKGGARCIQDINMEAKQKEKGGGGLNRRD